MADNQTTLSTTQINDINQINALLEKNLVIKSRDYCAKYYEKNRETLLEKRRLRYQKEKEKLKLLLEQKKILEEQQKHQQR